MKTNFNFKLSSRPFDSRLIIGRPTVAECPLLNVAPGIKAFVPISPAFRKQQIH